MTRSSKTTREPLEAEPEAARAGAPTEIEGHGLLTGAAAIEAGEPNLPPLELSEAAMRALGASVMDQIVRHRRDVGHGPASRVLSRAEADALLDEPMPEEGSDPLGLVQRLETDVFDNISHVDHPRFFAFVPGPSNFVATMGAALVAGHNVFSGTWLGGSAAARLEQTVVRWLREAVGYPVQGGGLFLSGGSMANLTAIGAARNVRLGGHDRSGVVYYSDQTHSAVERALRVLGFRREDMRKLKADPVDGLSVQVIASAIERDIETGNTPFCVVVNAGTTNTGAVDPLDAVADLCQRHGLWMHVDGAYGAAAILGAKAKASLTGLDRADSIALDPHKWLFQPFESGCLLVRDAAALREAYSIHPEYMRDTLLEDEEINFCEYGVQLSRSFRALGLWLTLKTFGRKALADAIDGAFDLADYAAEAVSKRDGWELVTPPRMAILTFRYAGVPPEHMDSENARIVRELREGGTAMVSSTLIEGQYVIRLCPTNPRTTRGDIDRTLDALDRIARA